MIETAKKFIRAWKRERAARNEKKALGARLDRRIRVGGAITVGKDRIVLESNGKKCPTKEQLIQAFGKEGEAFWDALPPATYQYLTVVPAKAKKKTG